MTDKSAAQVKAPSERELASQTTEGACGRYSLPQRIDSFEHDGLLSSRFACHLPPEGGYNTKEPGKAPAPCPIKLDNTKEPGKAPAPCPIKLDNTKEPGKAPAPMSNQSMLLASFCFYAGALSVRHPVVCFRGRATQERSFSAVFPLFPARFFNTRHRAFYISGNRRQPYEQTFRAAVFLCVLLKFPVCFYYISGARFALLNSFAVSM